MNQHCADEAELYALGLTEPGRAAEIEQHCAHCADCRTRVIAAEAAAAALASALPAARPARAFGAPRHWTSALAAAAAVVFAVSTAVEGVALHGSSQSAARTDLALAAVASSHFAHTTLSSAPGSAAKALYARDGSWLYLIADGVGGRAHAIVRRGARQQDLGELGAGEPATLFVRDAGRVNEILLVDGGRTVAQGIPAY